jgi:hypothetical protein
MNRNPLVLNALVMLERRGLAPVIDARGKHLKIRWSHRGRRFVLVVPRTPSGGRSLQNSRAMLRRILRNGARS